MTLLKASLVRTPSLKSTESNSKKKKRKETKIRNKEAIYNFIELVSWLTCISLLLIKCKQGVAVKIAKWLPIYILEKLTMQYKILISSNKFNGYLTQYNYFKIRPIFISWKT